MAPRIVLLSVVCCLFSPVSGVNECPCVLSHPNFDNQEKVLSTIVVFKFTNVSCLSSIQKITATFGGVQDLEFELPNYDSMKYWPSLQLDVSVAVHRGEHPIQVRAYSTASSNGVKFEWNFILKLEGNVKTIFDYHSNESLDSSARSEFFDAIYETSSWTDNGIGLINCPLSGCGSSVLGSNLARNALLEIVNNFNINTISEVGCGDHEWLSLIDFDDLNVNYFGYDISNIIIEQNKRKYQQSKHRQFEVLDGVISPPPISDLVIFRHVLMHLNHEDNLSLLRMLIQQKDEQTWRKPRYLLASIHLNTDASSSLSSSPMNGGGDRKHKNIKSNPMHSLLMGGTKEYLAPPFCLVPPLRMYQDDFEDPTLRSQTFHYGIPIGMLALWDLTAPGGLVRSGPGCLLNDLDA